MYCFLSKKMLYDLMSLDINGDDILRDLQKSTMGIYVINKEDSAMMLGVIYALNMAYLKHLKYYYEFIQKVLFRMDSERRSPKILGLKNKISAGL
uniref:Uncharacterized protein n=1 Tax=Scleropages formosus TaxID=113540 RepID=A0A8C9VG49_SCLFO